MKLQRRFDLYHDPFLDHEIQPLLAEFDPVVVDAHPVLTRNPEAEPQQLELEGGSIHVFEKSEAQLVVDAKEGADDAVGEPFLANHRF